MNIRMSFRVVWLVSIMYFTPGSALPQPKGIQFEKADSWQSIQDKAKQENKYIFVDCYATWCGPCRYMDQHIFSLDEVGTFMNAHFVSVKVQMNETKNDPREVKAWYEKARLLQQKYSITAYPTYLFFSPDGNAVHRIVGTAENGAEFIGKSAEALNPDKQYYTIINPYQDHQNDSAYLRKALTLALASSDDSSSLAVGKYYMDCLKTPLSKDNLDLIWRLTKSSTDKGFLLINNNLSKVDEVEGKDFGEHLLRSIIFQEEIAPFFEQGAPELNWSDMEQKLQKKYPLHASRIIAESKPKYYSAKKNWLEYEKSILDFMKHYGDQLGDYDTNNIAWNIFLNSNNLALLKEALVWSSRTISNYPDVGDWEYVDTYANLLYKTDDKENALLWEKKAIDVAGDPGQKKEFEETLKKMEKGEKTWN